MTAEQLGLLGLGARAGSVVVGANGVRAALKRGELALVVFASDTSRRTVDKVGRLAEALGTRTVTGPVAQELGRRVGRAAVQAVGVRDVHLAAGIVGSAAPAAARRT